MNKIEQSVGVVGAGGDLGGRVLLQACTRFEFVLANDIDPLFSPLTASCGVDPSIKPNHNTTRPRVVQSVDEILKTCTVIHWCAPLSELEPVQALPGDSLLVLHDSVLGSSVAANDQMRTKPAVLGKIVAAHCLVHSSKRVAIATDTTGTEVAMQHFIDLGLDPLAMSALEHDVYMGKSQAPLALLTEVLTPDLRDMSKAGVNLLTPSTEAFLELLETRDVSWTGASKDSILANPELPVFLRDLLKFVEKRQKSLQPPKIEQNS